ncbi:MAG: GTPase Era [Ureaplasma sp.]|nr:GTPase Era [Ureaplasma sp.]
MSELINLLKVSIIGKPNVGKSSLINTILQKKASIVNNKPQTTRNKISFDFEFENNLIIFTDTPGFHNPKYKLDNFLNKFVENSLKDLDLIYLLIDLTRKIDDEDEQIIQKALSIKKPIFLIFTKKDLIKETTEIENIQQDLINQIKPLDVFYISSVNNDLNDLLNKTIQYSIKNNFLMPKELYRLSNSDNFEISEIIREQCLNLLKDEIPYGVAVLIENTEYDKIKNLFSINAAIVVERESHKGIVVGAKGKMIKEISTNSRLELLKIYDCNIFLKIYVKVDKNWRNDLNKIKEFGYFN